MFAITARHGSSEPSIVDVADPSAPAHGQVLCRTLQMGVCGTDRDILLSSKPLTPPDAAFLILGHECLARVEAVGAEVERLSVGDLVVPVVRRPLDPREQRPDLLPFGRYTERGIVREHGFTAPLWLDQPEYLYVVPEEIESVAVLAEPMSVAEKGVHEALALQSGRLGNEAWRDPPPRVLVTGMGPIGFAAVVACRCRQWPVVMYGRDPAGSFRAELAVALGARYAPAEEFQSPPGDVEDEGYDLVLECTGNAGVMTYATQSLASCGVMVWLGSCRSPKPETLEIERTMRHGVLRNHIHVGCVNAAPRDFVQALRDLARAWKTNAGQLESFITERVKPAESLWHFSNRQPQGIKTVLIFEGG